jgi:hypothetical protein
VFDEFQSFDVFDGDVFDGDVFDGDESSDELVADDA